MEATAFIIYIAIGIVVAACAFLGSDPQDRRGFGPVDIVALTIIALFWPTIVISEENENE